MFLQIHTLTSHGASLINRDQDGFAKRLPFGGVTRLRISSQCLKRHWRTHQGEHALSTIPMDGGHAPMSIRSRVTFRDRIRDRLVHEQVPPALATQITEEMMRFMLGEASKAKTVQEDEPVEKSKKVKGKKAVEVTEVDLEEACRTNQITILGEAEIDFLYQETHAVLQLLQEHPTKDAIQEAIGTHFTFERRKNLRGLLLGGGLDAALFGRMVTSRNFDNIDAAVQVAHALTVHAAQTEMDFFSAVDDLEKEIGHTGSGHIGNTELTTGLYYGYVTVDVPLLVANLAGSQPLAQQVIQRLVHLIATVSPGAKLGSTAPHAYAQLVLIERGRQQPRSLANAFLKPLRETPDLLEEAYQALALHLDDMTQMFGALPEHRFAAMGPVQRLMPALSISHRMTVSELASWASSV